MSLNPLNIYVKLSRLVFSVEASENWEDYDEFESNIKLLYEKLCCVNCENLLVNPVIPKKNHFSCQHRVCLDCIGRKRSSSYIDCKMCNDYTLFEKNSSIKYVLECFQELCELIHSSWIYEYIKKQRITSDTGQKEISLIEIIENGMNYGKISIVIDDTSSEENSCSSDSIVEETIPVSTSLAKQKILDKPPSPVKSCTNLVHNVQLTSEQVSKIINNDSSIPVTVTTSAPVTQPRPLVQFPVQSPMPGSSRLLASNQQQNFIKYPSPPVRLATTISPSKSILTPMKLQATPSTSQIYSVMYTGSGNKITLKRKPPDEVSPSQQLPLVTNPATSQASVPVPINSAPTNNNSSQTTTILKTDNVIKQPTNVISNPVTTNQLMNQSNEKRRGCRCGNATAAPGKLTCCGQRCPCYVDSKACIDCKCRGCRNPHFIDGHKKMRHPVPDQKTQQQQQQNFLASMQQQVMIKDKPSVIPSTSDLSMSIEKSTITNCLIGNGFQLKTAPQPRLIVKDSLRSINPMIFNTSPSVHQNSSVATSIATNSNIQIVGLYSQVPMIADKKIIIKNDHTSVVSFSDATKQPFDTSTSSFTNNNNLNTNLL